MASAFPILAFFAILTAALNAGLFFIFSVCIMATVLVATLAMHAILAFVGRPKAR